MKKFILVTILIIFSILIVACNDEDKKSETEKAENGAQTETEEGASQVEFLDEERVDADLTVLKVNGEEIKGDKYNSTYTYIKTTMSQQGQDTSDINKVKEEVISVLTQQELIQQDAVNRGIEVTDEEAQEELDKLTEEQYNQVLETNNLTEEEFKKQLINDLVFIKYIEQEFKAEVTADEIESYYNQLKEQNEELPELDDAVKGEIEALLKSQKQRELLAKRVSELQEDAEIEQLL